MKSAKSVASGRLGPAAVSELLPNALTITYRQAMTLALIIDRGLTYREVATRLCCTNGETLADVRAGLHNVRALLAVSAVN